MLQPPLVLVVDDDDFNLRMCAANLRQEGMEALTALGGEQALEQARERQPDVILLDIIMPGMDGYQVLERLKEDPALAAIPVIMLTGRQDSSAVVKALDKGAHDYLKKPFDISEMVARVRSAVRLRRAERSLNESRLRMLSELSLARAIQLSMQPGRELLDDLAARGLGVFQRTESASEVSGDFCDIRRLSSDLVGLALVDCKGSGAAAGMMTMAVQAILQGVGPFFVPSAKEPLYQADVKLKDLGGAIQPVGMTYLSYHLEHASLSIGTAGMPAPICCDDGGEDLYPLPTGAAPLLGGKDALRLSQTEHTLQPGGKLVLYTPGLPAARRGEHGPVGLEEAELMDLLRKHGGLPAAELGDLVMTAWRRKVGPEHSDDCTLVILENLS